MKKREHEHQSPDECYDEFWKSILEKDGVLDPEQVKKELHDFHFMIQQVPLVYDDLTGGRISKPNTYAYEVIAEAHNHLDQMHKSIAWSDVSDMVDRTETREELIKELEEYCETE